MPKITYEILFEWDPRKAQTNLSKHGVSFQAALFKDPLQASVRDTLHGASEERWITLGKNVDGRLLVVVHTWIESNTTAQVRIISARPATRHERRHYEN